LLSILLRGVPGGFGGLNFTLVRDIFYPDFFLFFPNSELVK
jgi:hypothetical protein